MTTVTIAGVGLIGGSFALALRQAGFEGRILGVSSPDTLTLAIKSGVIDAGASLEQATRQSDLIYLALPIHRIIEVLPQLNEWVRPGALITDAGSTKVEILRAATSIKRCTFIGGHPLAGKESRGVNAADANLFTGRRYVLTPTSPEITNEEAVQDFVSWLRRIKAIPVIMDAAEHDRTLAHTSHLVQLASTALASYLGGQGKSIRQIFGPALLDVTRVAMSSFAIWSDIIETNHGDIDSALSGYITELQRMREHLGTEQARKIFEDGADLAKALREPSNYARDSDFF